MVLSSSFTATQLPSSGNGLRAAFLYSECNAQSQPIQALLVCLFICAIKTSRVGRILTYPGPACSPVLLDWYWVLLACSFAGPCGHFSYNDLHWVSSDSLQ